VVRVLGVEFSLRTDDWSEATYQCKSMSIFWVVCVFIKKLTVAKSLVVCVFIKNGLTRVFINIIISEVV